MIPNPHRENYGTYLKYQALEIQRIAHSVKLDTCTSMYLYL